MSAASATREEHDDFCTIEEWILVRGARGKPVKHHRTYKLSIPDGRILRTRVSRPVDSTQYARSMWIHILREQLSVMENEFWECVDDKVLPDRSIASDERPGLPYYLAVEIQRVLKLDADEAATLSEAEAKRMIAEHWTEIAKRES
jgi:hypothetical protein